MIRKGATQSSNLVIAEPLKITADTSKSTQINCSLVIYNRDSIYLYGNQKLDKTVSILNFETGLFFETITTSYTQYESDWETDEFILMKIKDLPSNRIQGKSNAFFSKKPPDFALFKLEEIKNNALAKYVDSLIRKSSLLD